MAETKELLNTVTPEVQYDEDNIRHMDDMEHIRTRPGMYIGKLGDGSQADDGIYVLLKEVIDNSVDEFRMNCGKRIEITRMSWAGSRCVTMAAAFLSANWLRR